MILNERTVENEPTSQNPEKPTLLIVDDEPGPRESLRIVFKDRYNCAVANCGREGLEIARSQSIDAAIVDVKMPDLSGVDVLKEIKKIDPHTECIILTGYETVETARAAVRYGAADYLNKPFDVFSIRELLERCIARRQQKLAAEKSLQSLQTINQELSQDLAHSNRALSAGVLSAGVVHELNNPLSIIAGYAQMLGRDLAALGVADQHAQQHIQKRLDSIRGEIERCKDIANRFLNFTRKAQQSEEVTELGKLLEDATALIKAHPANQGTEVSFTVSEPDLRIKAQPAEMLQMLIDLGVNAYQSMSGAGSLQYSAERADAPPAKWAFRSKTFDPQRPLVRLSVTDSGSGISEENIEKIFQPYFTTREQGTGLGLAILSELVDRHGGAIEVKSTVGQGSTFSLYLPLST